MHRTCSPRATRRICSMARNSTTSDSVASWFY
jgi:hypothetical protein